jgi:hypothetical protein
MVWSRTRLRIVLSTVILAGCSLATVLSSAPVPAAATTAAATIWLQTMDSCKQAVAGAAYDLSGGGITLSVADASTAGRHAVGVTPSCPLQQGDCSSISTGCVQFTNVPPGTYRIVQTRTPPPNATNPEGYAPCEGGSACQSERVDVTVSPTGQVSATVTNVYPDGLTVTWPTNGGPYLGSAIDPVVVHDFGLGSGSCDGDGDADDHLTGTPSSHCGYPEAQEGSVQCHPYPWSCQIAGSSGGAQSTSHHRTSSTTSGGGGSGPRPQQGTAGRPTSRTTTRSISPSRTS